MAAFLKLATSALILSGVVNAGLDSHSASAQSATRCTSDSEKIANGLVTRPSLLKADCGSLWKSKRNAFVLEQWVEVYTFETSQTFELNQYLEARFKAIGYLKLLDARNTDRGQFTMYGTTPPGVGVMLNIRKLDNNRSYLTITGPYSTIK